MIIKVALKIAVNSLAIYVASAILEDVIITAPDGKWWEYYGVLALIGAVVWVGNAIVKPFLKVLTFPLILVTFGLFNVVLNMLILWGADIVLPQLEITGFLTLLWASLIVSFVNGLLFFI